VIARLRDLRARDLLAPQVILLAAIVAVMAVTFAVIIATLDRGFDWSDEAFVDAMIVSDRASSTEFFGFQHLLNPVYELLGGSVLALRILRLLGYVALGVALTFIARAVLRMIAGRHARGVELPASVSRLQRTLVVAHADRGGPALLRAPGGPFCAG
jgi:hypothetical protein